MAQQAGFPSAKSGVAGTPGSCEPCISLEGVGVRYRVGNRLFQQEYVWPLEDVSFRIYTGETLGIIGRNGAGKSTLMQLLAGIIRPDRGTIHSADLSAMLLSLQVGFQPHLTGRENAFQSGLLLGMTHRQVKQSLDAIAAFAEISEHFDRPVRTYSMGMRARLGFAVAVQAEPDILLIDEVLGVGDKDFRVRSRDYLLSRIKSDETVVIVSHNEDTLLALCDRVVWVERGVTRMEGEPKAVLTQYMADGRRR